MRHHPEPQFLPPLRPGYASRAGRALCSGRLHGNRSAGSPPPPPRPRPSREQPDDAPQTGGPGTQPACRLAYGRIATTTDAQHGLVAFVRQQYEGTEPTSPNKGRQRWRDLARQTPALQLDVDGRMVSVAAGEYEIDERLHMPLTLAAFGLVFFAVGLAGAYDSWRKDVDLAGQLRAAPVVDAANIGAQQVGATVLVEGTVAARNPVIESGLVTLLRQEAEAVSSPGKSDRRISWRTLRAEARPLWVDTPAGAVAIVNSDYAWRDSPRRVPDDPGTITPGTLRAAGFGVGDAIVVQAVVVTHAGAAALRAVEIDAGTRAAYLADKQASDWVGYIIGGAFALVGLALLVGAGIGIRRASAAPMPGTAERS